MVVLGLAAAGGALAGLWKGAHFLHRAEGVLEFVDQTPGQAVTPSMIESEIRRLEASDARKQVASEGLALRWSREDPLHLGVIGTGRDPRTLARAVETMMAAAEKLSAPEDPAGTDKRFSALKAEKEKFGFRLKNLVRERRALWDQLRRLRPNGPLAARLVELEGRRDQLARYFPKHADIRVLEAQIRATKSALRKLPSYEKTVYKLTLDIESLMSRLKVLDKEMAEAAADAAPKSSLWRVSRKPEPPLWPSGLQGGLWVLAGVLGGSLLGVGICVLPRPRRAPSNRIPLDIVGGPEVPWQAAALAVSSERRPLFDQTKALYDEWMNLVQTLYAPQATPPTGVVEKASALIQKTIQFLPRGGDALARHVARSVTPDDLTAHVTHVALVCLSNGEGAGVTAEHRLALVVAALCHDLALVPRKAHERWEEGIEPGRLSVPLVRKLPGMTAPLLAAVESILLASEEMKSPTWQDSSSNAALAPLSRLLREVDRFERLLQRQRLRVERRLSKRTPSFRDGRDLCA